MITIEKGDIFGWEPAIRGMRNPMNSWAKSDSGYCMDSIACHTCQCNRNFCKKNIDTHAYVVGHDDYELMMRLCKAGPEHAKFMRMIVVYLDITAPLYWWKEFDTYKIGTVTNSCSTMHKIAAKEFTRDDFSCEHLTNDAYDGNNDRLFLDIFDNVIDGLNQARATYVETKDKLYWWQMIQLLPSSYNQKRTEMLNYEVLSNIYRQRTGHKLDEWNDFCAWIETLPYSELITGEHNNDI